jgi:hypothetical protein
MAGHYRIDLLTWQAIQGLWEPRIAQSPQLAGHSQAVDQEARRLLAGGAPRPVPTLQVQSFERNAEQAASAIGNAAIAGFSALGSALDSLGKSLSAPAVGSRVMVQWSDGHRYPGTVTQVAQGQYHVTMQNGQQLWVHASYVTLA